MNPISTIIPDLLGVKPYLRNDAVIVFVCGKRLDAADSKRKIFIDYASRHLRSFHFLLAEDFFKFMEDKNENLLTVENKLADYSDCIIIILESESAFAELGAFAASDSLCKVIIPVNDRKHVLSESFINLGPLRKIDNLAHGFGPTIPARMDSFTHCFSSISDRLDKIKRSNTKSLILTDATAFIRSHKERLLLLYEIVNLFGPVKSSEIVGFFIGVYGKARLDVIHFDLSLLLALNFICKVDGYFVSIKKGLSFVGFRKGDNFSIRSKVILYYKRKAPERLFLLSGGHCNG